MLKLIGDYMCNEIIKRENKNSNQNKNWSVKEYLILLNNYKQLGYNKVANLVNRSPSSCRNRLYRLRKNNKTIKSKYQMFNKKWTTSEDNFLKTNYPDKGAKWCGKHLNRSPSSCISRAITLKIKRSYHWSKDEDDIIKKYYPLYGINKVSKLLNRNKETCFQRAHVLGVKYINTSKWSESELNFLKKYYPEKGGKYVAEKLNRSYVACHSKAAVLKLKTIPKWSENDKKFLKKYYPKYGATWCAEKLNKTPRKCITYASKHKIRYINKALWTEEEIAILKKYYPIIGKFVSEIIKTKNEKACSQKATRLKITYTKDDSSAVEKIKSYLNSQKIVYRQEVGLEGCVDKNPLLFDFAIYEDNNLKKLIGIIEYDGSQHFLPTTLYSDKKINAKEVLEITQRHDQIKNRYCQKNKIPMLRIKYCQNNIEKLVAEFLKHREKYIEWYNQEYSFEKYYSEIEDEELRKYFIHFSKYKNKGIPNINPNFCINKWSRDDDLFLEKYYPDNGSLWVSKRLHKTQSACINHANKLGIVRSNHWKREEDAFVLKYYLSKGPLWISKKLKRTKNSIEHRAHRLGAEKRIKYWTKEEDQILLSNWNIKSEKELSEIIGRTKMSIGNRKKILRKYRTKEQVVELN